ncbi:uncharacterized protein LOC106669567 isoform X2 [Cimex lectularius]|uniref:Uncharacterized protein n=1 Tax=Cimex lectularius TaxID=79782 RepID=A0A8I6SL87_CIMLE|nr:uncharacterized protein LOC106669567 isoform X2 [Cimex lectularius]
MDGALLTENTMKVEEGRNSSDSDEGFHEKLMKKMYPGASKASLKADEPYIEWTASYVIPRVHQKRDKAPEGREVVARTSFKNPESSEAALYENPNLELAADEAMMHIMTNASKIESNKDPSTPVETSSRTDEIPNRNSRLMNSVSYLQRAGNETPQPQESKSAKIQLTEQEMISEKVNPLSHVESYGSILKIETREGKTEKLESISQTRQKNHQESIGMEKAGEEKPSFKKDFTDKPETPPDYKSERTPSSLLSPREFVSLGKLDRGPEAPSKHDFHLYPSKPDDETSPDDFTEILIPASKAKVSEESTLNKRVKDEAMYRKSLKEGGSAKRVSWKEEQPTVVPYIPERSPRRRITRSRSSSKEETSWSTISGPKTTMNSSWSDVFQGNPQPSFLRTKIDDDDSDDEFDNTSRCCCFRISK